MKLTQYWHAVNTEFSKHLTNTDKWRWGQTCFNVLHEVRPDLADQIVGTDLDPFHADVNDKQYARFTNWLHKNWEE